MSELETLLAEVRAIAARPVIPVEQDLWDGDHAAAYLKCSRRQVLERYAPMPDFPRAIRLPTKKGSGHPLWRAQEVVAWATKYLEKN